jgi:hypothetical protein
MLDAEQVVPTSGSSSYRTQALVKFMIAFCGAFTLTFGSGPLGWLLHVRRQATLR